LFELNFLGVSKFEYIRTLDFDWSYTELTSIEVTETPHIETSDWLIEMELWMSGENFLNISCFKWKVSESLVGFNLPLN